MWWFTKSLLSSGRKKWNKRAAVQKEIHPIFIHLPSCRRNRKRKKMEMECLIQLLMTHLPCNQSVLTIKIRLLLSFCQAAQKTTRHVTSMKSYQDIIIWNSFFCICSHSFVRALLHITKAFHILLPYVLFYLNCNLSSVSIFFGPDNTRKRQFQVNGEDK